MLPPVHIAASIFSHISLFVVLVEKHWDMWCPTKYVNIVSSAER
jgi:hypothetical protein